MVDINQIVNCDCMAGLNLLEDNSVNLIVTSPPYNKGYFSHQSKPTNQVWDKFSIKYNSYDDNLPLDEYENWMIEFINLCMKKLKPDGSMFFNHKPIRHDNEIYHPLNFILKSDAKIYQEIIWNRMNSPNIRSDCLVPCTERIYWLCKGKPVTHRECINPEFMSEVWNISPKAMREHPAPFPIQIPDTCIQLCTSVGDLVVDPFMGSGTTAIACINSNRNYIGFEIDDKYIQVAEQRIANNKDIFDE